MGTTPNICPIHNTPVFHARRAFGCECENCQGPAEREVEPSEEEIKKQIRREKLSEEIMQGTKTTYEGGGRSVRGGHVPEAAVDDVKGVI